MRILFVDANPPDDTERILPEAEFRNLLHKLRATQHRTAFELHALPAARIGDLPDELRAVRPHILHFACHGDEDDGSLVLTARTSDRTSALLHPDDFAETLRVYQDGAAEKLRLVVLAGCWTDVAARAVSRHVDAAVGMAGAVDDPPVVNIFTPALYAALGDGRSVANAVDGARVALQAEHGYGNADMVKLHGSLGSDPAQLKPLAWERLAMSPAHLAYLRSWFGKPWCHVSLADIVKQRQQQADLLAVYVPLRVDFALTLRTQEQRIVDWSVQREEHERAKLPEDLVVGSDAALPAQERVWVDLGVGEAGLQAIVDSIQDKIVERRTAGKNTEDGDHSWYMEAHDAASVQPRFVLLGEPGSGKSSFLRHLTLCLAGELLATAGDASGGPRGLPIGNLTSQFWANVYLNEFDWFVAQELGCGAYLRYVDDFALFGDSKRQLWEWKAAIVDRLAALRLTVHGGAAQVQPVAAGIPWLGFVVFPTHRRLKRRNVVNFTRRLAHNLDLYRGGAITFAELDAGVQGWINHVRFGDTWGLRNYLFRRHRVAGAV